MSNWRRAAYVSTTLLSLLILVTLCPISFSSATPAEAAPGTAQDSIITLSATKPTASVSLNVTSTSGSTATSNTAQGNDERATFTVATNNAKGYKLSIKSSSGTTLSNGTDTLDAIGTSGITLDTFSTNTWGYLPSYYNSTANSTLYYPITTSDVTLRETNTATSSDGISNPDTYTIALGLKADYTKSAGTYTNNNIVLTAIANPTPYTITYDKGDAAGTPSNMPGTNGDTITNPQTGAASDTSVTLSSKVPELTGYDFTGWCLGTISTTNNVDSCTGTGAKTFQPGATFGIDRTLASNTATLHAMWNLASVVVTVNFAGSGVTGVTFTNSTYGNQSVSTSGGTANLKYGVEYTIAGTYSSGYEFVSWSATAGTLGSTSSASTTYSTTTSATLTLTGKASCSTITFKTSNASSINFNGTNYPNNGSVCVANGTYWIYGNYASKYAFSSWANTAGSFANSSYQVTQYTVAGDATITLTGQSVGTTIQSITSSTCTTTAKPVYDSRDNEVYWIQKLADGNCWMLDNLRLGSTSTITLTSSNTNSNGNYTLPASGTTCFATTTNCDSSGDSTHTGYTVAAINTTSKNNIPKSGSNLTVYGPGTGKIGTYYNFCAASAGTICVASNPSGGNASYDICPAGWKMPTGGSSGQYNSLYTNSAIGSDASKYRITLSTPLSGYFYNGSATDQGTTGLFWSVTRSINTVMYSLGVYSSYVNPTSNNYRYFGNSVRCILKVNYMQDQTSSSLATLLPNTGDTTTLVDKRDNNEYLVGKLADGKYWMLDNLALDLTDSTVQSKLTSSTTNATDQALGYLKGTTTGKSTDQWAMAAVKKTWTSSYSYSQPWIAVDSSTSGVCNNAYCVNSNKSWSSTSVTSKTINGVTSIAQGKIGVYYNYCAASAGSYCWGNGTSYTGSPSSDPNTSSLRDITSDICPYGWHLPTSTSSGEFAALYTAYSSNVTNFQTALSTPLSGYFVNGKAYYQGYGGFFWSSTWYNGGSDSTSNMYYLRINSGSANPSNNYYRNYGLSVRCVFGS